MSFHIPLTPHDLAKGAKDSKGLHKLKYYCQLCKKQCADKNGFNCHLVSNTHLMHMRLFSENPDKYIDDYSKDFEEGYLEVLRKKYYGQKVLANKVYQDFIRDRQHTHMNATKWTTLTGFVDYLKERGKIESEWTDEGLFVQYADATLDSVAKKKEEDRKLAARLKKEEKEKLAMDEQMELAKKFQEESKGKDAQPEEPPAPVDLQNNHQQISFSFAAPVKPLNNALKAAQTKSGLQPNIMISLNPQKNLDILSSKDKEPEINKDGKRKTVSGIEKVLENAKAQKKVKPDPFAVAAPQKKPAEEEDQGDFTWVVEGIIVKIKDESLPKYNNQKAKIVKVIPPFIAEVEIVSNKAKLQIDQELLETVIPVIGNPVKVLKKGPYFGKVAILESIHQDNFTGSVLIEETDTALELPFEMISKAVS